MEPPQPLAALAAFWSATAAVPNAKSGWQYLWVLYEDAEDADAKRMMKRPTTATCIWMRGGM